MVREQKAQRTKHKLTTHNSHPSLCFVPSLPSQQGPDCSVENLPTREKTTWSEQGLFGIRDCVKVFYASCYLTLKRSHFS